VFHRDCADGFRGRLAHDVARAGIPGDRRASAWSPGEGPRGDPAAPARSRLRIVRGRA
jgi:hypothetical protein